MRLRDTRPWAPAAIVLGSAVVAAAVALPGGSGSEHPTTTPTYHLPAEKVRESEAVPLGKTGRSADMLYTVIGFREGMTEVMGTHAAMESQGTFTRIRILAVNSGRDIQVFDLWQQRLVTSDGKVLSPDVNATMIKRQPERMSVGAAMRVEFDLWFDVPRAARVKAVRLSGSPPVGAVSDPDPAEIALP